MAKHMRISGLEIEIIAKNIKNVHLSVHPPRGRVRMAAPKHMSAETLRLFAIAKLPWIKRQQAKFCEQERETDREYIDRESHYLWGQRYLLQIIELSQAPSVEVTHGRMVLRVRPSTTTEKRKEILDEWYREQLREAVPELLEKWQQVIGVKVQRVFVQHMKTKWGSCNHRTGNIRLNTELAKKSRECLEYIIVHEMIHLIEPTHNERFMAMINKLLPRWGYRRDALNRLPLRHENWEY